MNDSLTQKALADLKNIFEDLLERIREIRAGERRFYQKITDIYALSVDYDPDQTHRGNGAAQGAWPGKKDDDQ